MIKKNSKEIRPVAISTLVGAGLLVMITGLGLLGTGCVADLERYAIPAILGGIFGGLVGEVLRRGRRRETLLKRQLNDRHSELKVEIESLQGIRRRLTRKTDMLNAVNQVLQKAYSQDTEKEGARKCLEIARSLTNSEMGWIGEVNENGRLDTIAMSVPEEKDFQTIQSDRASFDSDGLIRNLEIRGLWDRVICGGNPLIANDPANHPDRSGVPEGHPEIRAFMGVPLWYSNRVIGMFALANKADGYQKADQEDMVALSSAFAETLQQKRMEAELKEKSEKLENHVAELQRANQRIVDQQQALVEEERLKVMLEMAGASVNELQQPLTDLMENIRLMESKNRDPEKVDAYLAEIAKHGRRIGKIVKRMQRLHSGNKAEGNGDENRQGGEKPLRVLSVEDSDFDFKILSRFLQKDVNPYQIERAQTIQAAFGYIERGHFDLILLDYRLPDGTGLDFLNRMHLSGLELPVVVITARGDEFVATEVFRAGAYDYLPKEKLSRQKLVAVIANAREKFLMSNETRTAMKKMAELTIKDELTGLYNRRYCMDSLHRELSLARRYDRLLSVCMFDIDHFKQVNDEYGHLCGDTVLRQFGRILEDGLRQSDIPCRFGGEEFVVVLPETPANSALVFSERIRNALADHSFHCENQSFRTTVSGGIAEYQKGERQMPEDLIAVADRALYAAKDQGRNRIMVSRTEEALSAAAGLRESE
ncbi:MAG: sensor domain-containing diguanylate cyclase [Thermodesulfobacteriota bacterium]